MSGLVVASADAEPAWTAVRAIRQAVFVEEQACPPEEEWDAHDAPAARGRTAHHLLGTVDGEAVACARWRPVETASGPAAKLERFAILAPFRGRGLGRQIVAAAMRDAQDAGYERLVLHAQVHLEPFYRSFGFDLLGGPFWEVGIEHVKMEWAG